MESFNPVLDGNGSQVSSAIACVRRVEEARDGVLDLAAGALDALPKEGETVKGCHQRGVINRVRRLGRPGRNA